MALHLGSPLPNSVYPSHSNSGLSETAIDVGEGRDSGDGIAVGSAVGSADAGVDSCDTATGGALIACEAGACTGAPAPAQALRRRRRERTINGLKRIIEFKEPTSGRNGGTEQELQILAHSSREESTKHRMNYVGSTY